MGNIPMPKGFVYKAIYEPDQKRMVKALRTLVEYNPKTKEDIPEVRDQASNSKKTS